MKISFQGVFNTFSVYQEIRAQRYEVLRAEVCRHFSAVELPSSSKDIHLNITKDGISIGLLMLTPEDNTTIRLKHLCLRPEAQIPGTEQQVMIFAECWAKERQYSQAAINAHRHGVPLYMKLNYRQTGETINENGRLCFRMLKKI